MTQQSDREKSKNWTIKFGRIQHLYIGKNPPKIIEVKADDFRGTEFNTVVFDEVYTPTPAKSPSPSAEIPLGIVMPKKIYKTLKKLVKPTGFDFTPAKSPSPSGEEHGPHAARFLKGLEKSAQDIFESVTPEKTALMVNMSTPTSPVEDDWQKRMNDTKRILKMAAPGLARPNEPVEEGWVKVFYKKFVVSSQGNIIWDFIENGKHVTHKKLTDFIRSAISRARKEERLMTREIIEECGHQQDDGSVWCNMDVLLKKLKLDKVSLTALTDKLK